MCLAMLPNLNHDPRPPHLLRGGSGSSRSRKRIKNEVTGGSSQKKYSFDQSFGLRSVKFISITEEFLLVGFCLPSRRQVSPKSLERTGRVVACILKKLVERVQLSVAPIQGELAGVTEQVNFAEVVAKTVDLYIDSTIDIPKIVVLPKGEVTAGYRDFDLDLKGVHLQPVAKDILIAHLNDHAQYRLISGDGIIPEERLEDYLIRGLVDFDDVNYDEHADLLYKLAGEMVKHLQSYLPTEDDVRNVLQYHQAPLVNIIHAQMQDHYDEKADEYEAHITKGFTTLRPGSYSIPVGEQPRDFRIPVEEKLLIRGMLFGGFRKCLYPTQKFQVDTERRFAVILENDTDVVKWFKPGKEAFQIYLKGDSQYEPDFVVETKTAKLICETKMRKDIDSVDVQNKAKAAVKWCEHATIHEKQVGGKPWAYLLIPHDAVDEAKTIQGLAAGFTLKSPKTAVKV
jgi:type III restriction enzyme